MSQITFAIVGMGHIGKRHAQMVIDNPNAQLDAIIDIDQELLDDIKGHYQAAVFNSLEAYLSSGKDLADVICICSPNYIHCKQALLALDHSHVVIEKPMGLNPEECLEVIKKGETAGKQVFCVMQNRYSPPSQLLKSLLNENRLGKIYNVQVNCYWNRDDRYYAPKGLPHQWKGQLDKDGGVLFTQFSHFIDTIHWLFGPIEVTGKSGANFTHQNLDLPEDSGLFTFQLEEGGIGSFNYSTCVWDSNMESSISIIGETGSIKIAGQYMNEVVHCNIKDYELPTLEATNPPNDYGSYKGSAANHHYVIENVIDVLNNNKAITTNAQDGLEVVKIIASIYA